MQFVIATFNRNKVRELRSWFKDKPVDLLPLFEFSGASAPVETAATLEENARLKARAGLALTGLPTIGEDTGLEIDALSGRPGVRSARYAGVGANDRMNLDAVLEQMAKFPPGQRAARFRTVMVAAFPRRPEIVCAGVLEGLITREPRGEGGFGYDPIFEVTTLGRTLAELSLEEKNRISHRARAAQRMLEELGLA